MADKLKDLEAVSDLNMIQRYLRYGVEFHEVASCLIEDVGLKFEAQLRSADEKSMSLELEITKESFKTIGTESLKELDRPQSGIRISYSVNEATFFVYGKLQWRHADRVRVAASMPMYKLQRRDALRIKVMEAHKASVKLAGGPAIPLFDISAGGLSVVVTLEEQSKYQKDMTFPKAILGFMDKEIPVHLEVQNVLQQSKDGFRWKVGFRFKDLPASVEQMIAREAYLYTRKIWSRWL